MSQPGYEGMEVAQQSHLPEVATHHSPEVHSASPSNQYAQSQQQYPPSAYANSNYQTPVNKEAPYPPPNTSVYGAQDPNYYQDPSAAGAPPTKGRKRILGCSVLVFILSLIIALLAAAVIGLAAGTGVEAGRANDANQRVAELSSSLSDATKTVTVSVSGTSAIATSTPTSDSSSYSDIDNKCSDSDESTTGTTYTTQFFNDVTFTMYCNKNAANTPLISLFTANFNTCMDACASWSFYLSDDFDTTSSNTTCTAVSFIPQWTTKQGAIEGTAPGNCYLKSGTQTQKDLETPNIGGGEVHAAIVKT